MDWDIGVRQRLDRYRLGLLSFSGLSKPSRVSNSVLFRRRAATEAPQARTIEHRALCCSLCRSHGSGQARDEHPSIDKTEGKCAEFLAEHLAHQPRQNKIADCFALALSDR